MPSGGAQFNQPHGSGGASAFGGMGGFGRKLLVDVEVEAPSRRLILTLPPPIQLIKVPRSDLLRLT
jgi:hypothetical protein